MPLPKIYPESVVARFEAGTLERVKGVLRDGETRAEFIRTIVLNEVLRRLEESGAATVTRRAMDGDGQGASASKRKSSNRNGVSGTS